MALLPHNQALYTDSCSCMADSKADRAGKWWAADTWGIIDFILSDRHGAAFASMMEAIGELFKSKVLLDCGVLIQGHSWQAMMHSCKDSGDKRQVRIVHIPI